MSTTLKLLCRCIPLVVLMAAAVTVWAVPDKNSTAAENSGAAKDAPATAQKTEPVVTPELIVQGKAFFTGQKRFTNGAAPCAACHALANRGIEGGRLAADLGGLFTPDGADVIKDSIGAIEVPAMKKLYSAHPLTDGEYAALAAFARQPLPDKQPAKGFSFPVAGIGAGVLFLIVFMLYKRRIS